MEAIRPVPVTTEQLHNTWEELGYNRSMPSSLVMLVRQAVACTLHAQGRSEFVESLGGDGSNGAKEYAFRALGVGLKFQGVGSMYVENALRGDENDVKEVARRIRRYIMDEAGKAAFDKKFVKKRPSRKDIPPEPRRNNAESGVTVAPEIFIVDEIDPNLPEEVRQRLKGLIGGTFQIVLSYSKRLPFKVDRKSVIVRIVENGQLTFIPRDMLKNG